MNQSDRSKNLIKYLNNLQPDYFIKYNLEEIVNAFFKNEKKYSAEYSPLVKETSNNSYSSGSRYTKSIFITLNISSPKDYGIILLNRENRKYFPGYKQNFILETDMGIKTAHVTSGNDADIPGDTVAGHYLVANLPEWYRKHKELKTGSVIRIDIIEQNKKYTLSIHKV